MPVVRFESVNLTGFKQGKCADCDKRTKRTKRFTQTINPYNRNPDGSVKTRDQVYESVRSEIDRWKALVICAGCEERRSLEKLRDRQRRG